MSRLVSRAESWEKVYSAFTNINFAAFDYNTVKQSIIDYIKLYFPETFNDYIESSEFIAVIESFAYIAEILAYRLDTVAHENFISTAQRRDSILKLAKLVSYKVSRPLPARGLVKVTSISTTESVTDINGNNLSNRVIRWNDTINNSWKEQFILIINRVLEQEFGSIVATDRFQIQDVLFELYSLKTTQQVIPYTATAYGSTVNMELVPVAKSSSTAYTGSISGITERRPQQNAQFTIMYASDGLGDASDTTGFMFYTKQGVLQRHLARFDGITPNQTFEIPGTNINDTDVWVNAIDETTGEIIATNATVNYRKDLSYGKSGEWVEVDVAHAQNVIFNTNPRRNKYELETIGNNNQVRVLFGDGEFADIPQGLFEIYARTSLNEDIVIPRNSVVDLPIVFEYVDSFNLTQTCTMTLSLVTTLQNASSAETTEHVRQTAPSVYYTQDRMVNGEDYNVYMRQNPTILKLRAINRTFAGDSRYITWHDSSNTYENIKMFGTDGIMYYDTKTVTQDTLAVDETTLIESYVEPLLSSTDLFLRLTSAGVHHTKIRRVLNSVERQRMQSALTQPPILRMVDMYFNTQTNEWHAVKRGTQDNIVVYAYQRIAFNGFMTSDSQPIVYNTSGGNITSYSAGIIINNNTNIIRPITILLSEVPTTVGELLAIINEQITHAPSLDITAYIENGDIVFKTLSASITSITVVDGVLDGVPNPTIGRVFGDIITNPTSTEWGHVGESVDGYTYPTNFIEQPLIQIDQYSEADMRFKVSRESTRLIFQSHTTSFWNTNSADYIIDYDTDQSSSDTIVVLQANTNNARTRILKQNWEFNVLGQETITVGSDVGTVDINRISILPTDINQDGVPDYIEVYDVNQFGLSDVMVPKISVTVYNEHTGGAPYVPEPHQVLLPVYCAVNMGDIKVLVGDIVIDDISSPGVNTTIDMYWSMVNQNGDTLQLGDVSNILHINNIPPNQSITFNITIDEYVYFHRISPSNNWEPVVATVENIRNYVTEYVTGSQLESELSVEQYKDFEFNKLWKRCLGRDGLNFAWLHYSPRYQLVDPSPTNIIDMFIITRGYYISYKRWLEDPLALPPQELTPLSLRNDYGKLLDNNMMSDEVVLHPGKFKLIFGDKSHPSLRAVIKVIRSANGTYTDNQIKTVVVSTVRNFFDITSFEFGETFYFTELAAAIHMELTVEISSVILVPLQQSSQYGDLHHIHAAENEIIYPDINVEDVEIISSFTSTNMRLNG